MRLSQCGELVHMMDGKWEVKDLNYLRAVPILFPLLLFLALYRVIPQLGWEGENMLHDMGIKPVSCTLLNLDTFTLTTIESMLLLMCLLFYRISNKKWKVFMNTSLLSSKIRKYFHCAGLEVLAVCFDKHLSTEWQSVAKCIQALASKGKG